MSFHSVSASILSHGRAKQRPAMRFEDVLGRVKGVCEDAGIATTDEHSTRLMLVVASQLLSRLQTPS